MGRFDDKNLEFVEDCERALDAQFREADRIAFENQAKVLDAFSRNKVTSWHFAGSTGYGYGDEGRDVLSKVFASAFGAESGLFSPHILSGTHALTIALFGLLKKGDKLVICSGTPYDTLRGVIWGEGGTLEEMGVEIVVCDLADGKFDEEKIAANLPGCAVCYIQRSRGYELRESFSCDEIGDLVKFLRARGFTGCVAVDNCYGEFVETIEPVDVGADVIVGSLIKNPGGGVAPNGAYICGGKKYIERIAKRLTAPSLGAEVGSYEGGYRAYFEGLFLAPHVTAQAKKCSLLFGEALTRLGYENFPPVSGKMSDITRAVRFDSREKMLSFVNAIQSASPVDSFAECEPWAMPGYDDPIVMAAGTFVSGSSIELSADGPVKPPYTAYFQGGLTYEHGKCALLTVLDKLKN